MIGHLLIAVGGLVAGWWGAEVLGHIFPIFRRMVIEIDQTIDDAGQVIREAVTVRYVRARLETWPWDQLAADLAARRRQRQK